jgi:hypothetical protein
VKRGTFMGHYSGGETKGLEMRKLSSMFAVLFLQSGAENKVVREGWLSTSAHRLVFKVRWRSKVIREL